MPRPCKRRRICAMPSCGRFGPVGSVCKSVITMSLDEYECIRLIDLLGMTQEQCARQMGVARTTAQAIYASARAKLAECVVNGRELHLDGGEYVVCDGRADCCGRHCARHCQQFEASTEEKSDENSGNL